MAVGGDAVAGTGHYPVSITRQQDLSECSREEIGPVSHRGSRALCVVWPYCVLRDAHSVPWDEA